MKDCYIETIEVAKNSFKVLQLTDLHIDNKSCEDDLSFIDNIVKYIAPDLVILTGDNVITDEEVILSRINDIILSHGARLGAVLGNHDCEYSKCTRQKYMEFVASLEKSVNKTNAISGRYGNFVVDINFNNTNTFSLVCLDSGDYLSFKERLRNFARTPYAKIIDPQIAWYNEATASSKNVMLFCHIPMRAYALAWEYGLKTNNIDYGYARENLKPNMKQKNKKIICYPGVKERVFDSLKKNGKLRAVFAGHDHVNDFKIKFDDVYFVFGQKSGYNAYNNVTKGFEDNIGGTLITLYPNETFNIEQVIMSKLNRGRHE